MNNAVKFLLHFRYYVTAISDDRGTLDIRMTSVKNISTMENRCIKSTGGFFSSKSIRESHKNPTV